MFSGELLVRTITGTVLLMVMNAGLYGFIAWLPTFFVLEGRSVVTSLAFTTAMSLGGPVGASLGMWLSDRLGRKLGIMAFSAAAIALGVTYPLMEAPAAIAFVGFCLVTTFYVLVALIFALYIPELFPTDIRMRGVGFCGSVGRLTTIVTPYAVIAAYGLYGVMGVVIGLSGLLLLQLIVVATIGLETKRRSLEALAPVTEALALHGQPLRALEDRP